MSAQGTVLCALALRVLHAEKRAENRPLRALTIFSAVVKIWGGISPDERFIPCDVRGMISLSKINPNLKRLRKRR